LQIVDKDNATLGLRAEEESVFGVDADHLSICKFADPASSAFRIVSRSIASMSRDAITRAQNQNTPAGLPATGE
jgi:hypothetical protein